MISIVPPRTKFRVTLMHGRWVRVCYFVYPPPMPKRYHKFTDPGINSKTYNVGIVIGKTPRIVPQPTYHTIPYGLGRVPIGLLYAETVL